MAKVTVKKATKKKGVKKAPVSILTKLRRMAEKVPASELAKLPKDGSINYKHYLYGHPKK